MANLIQVQAMCTAMARNGYEVVLSLKGGSSYSNHSDNISKNGYRLHIRKKLLKNNRLDKYINFNSAKNAVRKYQPDICYLRSTLLLRQTLSSGVPIILELHNNCLHQGYKFLDRYWRRVLIEAVIKGHVKKVVCISQALSDYWIMQGIPSEHILTAHDGIDSEMFRNKMSREAARKKLNLPPEKKIVSYVGRLYKNRNIGNIVRLAESYPEALFLIVGGPEEQKVLFQNEADKKNLNNIIFTGQIPHEKVTGYLYASDVLLALWSSDVPTINYCSPLKVFEYMAAGRNIVAHGFPTIKEVLNSESALLVEPDSFEDLKNKVGKAINLHHTSNSARLAREVVFRSYTWDVRAKNILNSISVME